ncbi:hypothetical protein GRI33_12090 [Brucella sp. BO3]|uniref:hypothetical protein n=1 Tax=Brucella sp. BO3 TaxID=2691913 RepID=UPI0015F73E23|nr:hypothetical protein [Brucella sp. BO3]QMV27705.1 hypothetical protein GRI33_12090 [Brucella sp. BO3]
MLQKNGNIIRNANGLRSRFNYAEVIRVALNHESRGRPKFAMLIADWTGASDRTAENWMNGVTGPSGAYLIYLMQRSDEVFKTVLALAQRREILNAVYKQEKLQEQERQSKVSAPRLSDRSLQPPVVPVHVPDDPVGVPDPGIWLGTRQLWFIGQLELDRNVRAEHIASAFDVSVKTGKRDIALLKGQGIVSYVGSTRRGRYVLAR